MDCISIRYDIATFVSHAMTPVSKLSFRANLWNASQQQKLLSSPRFGTLRAGLPTCVSSEECDFSQTPVVIFQCARARALPRRDASAQILTELLSHQPAGVKTSELARLQTIQFYTVMHSSISYESRVRLKGCGGPFQSSEAILMILHFNCILFNSTPLAYIGKQSTVERVRWSFSEL